MCQHAAAQEYIYEALENGPLSIPKLLDILETKYHLDRDFAAAALLDAPEDVVVVRFVDNEVRLAR